MSRRAIEHLLQKQIADALTLEIAPPGKVSKAGVVWFSIDSADFAGAAPGARLGRGIVAGIFDLFLLHRGRTHFLEVKAPDGEFSPAQCAMAAAVTVAGGKVGIARDAAEALLVLDEWQIPRKRAMHIPSRGARGIAT